MTNIAQITVSKAVVAFVTAAMIFSAFVVPAKAQTTTMDQLLAQIAQLQAQIAALQSGSTQLTTGGNCAAIPAPLTMGSTGANVTALQNYLISSGESIPAGATGFFGNQTKAALASWQSKNGVSPAVGYYGPITAAAMAAKCTPVGPGPVTPTEPTEPTTPTTPSLQGGEGDLTVTTLIDGSIKLDLGKAEKVLEFEVEAKDSDVAINRVDFEFDRRPWLFFQEVNLLVDGVEVASMSRSSDFSEVSSSKWRARFSGLNLVIREDDTVDVALELVPFGSLNSSRISDTVKVTMTKDGLRFVDGAGISDTAGPNADKTATVTFQDVFGDGKVNVTIADNSPENATIVLNEKSRTNNVDVLFFDVEAEDSAMEIRQVDVSFTVSGTSTVGGVINRAMLYNGSTLLRSVAVSGTGATATTTFDFTTNPKISEDDTANMRVAVEFNRADSFTPLPTFTVNSVTVSADNSNFVTDVKTTPVSETHTLVVDGIVAKAKSMTVTQNNQNTTLTVKLDVTAYGADFWIGATTSTAIATNFVLPASTTIAVAPKITVAGVTEQSGTFRIQRGQTRELTATYTFTNNGTSLQYVTGNLTSLAYGNTAGTATGGTGSPFSLTGAQFTLPTIAVSQPTN